MNTEINRWVAVNRIVYNPKTIETTAKEGDSFKYMRAGNRHYVCKHGEKRYVIIQKNDPDGIPIIGCSGEGWTYAHDNDGCKHVAAFLDLNSTPAAALDKDTKLALLSAGWIGAHGNLYPPDTEEGEGIAAERQAEIDAAMDASYNTEYPETEATVAESATVEPESEPVVKESLTTDDKPPKEEPKMESKEETKKTYPHPDGTEFESARLPDLRILTTITWRAQFLPATCSGVSLRKGM